MADLRCPMCGKPNPNTNEVCRHCGARLKPLVVKGTPENESRPPSRPSTQRVSEDDLPDWLARIREEQSDVKAGPAPARGAPAPLEETAASRRPPEPSDLSSSDITHRIQREHPPASAFEEEELAEEGKVVLQTIDVPDWLARLRPAFAEEEEAAEEEWPATGPDWLNRIQSRKSTDGGTGLAPAPEAGRSGASVPEAGRSGAPAPEAGSPAEEEELAQTDWLDRIRLRTTAELTPPPVMAVGPAPAPVEQEDDWLSRLRTSSPEPPLAPEAGAGLAPAPEAGRSGASTPATEEQEDEADWLARLREHKGLGPPPPEPGPAAPVPEPETRRRVETLLRGTPTAKPPPPEPEPESAVPDWLASIRAKETPVIQEPEPPHEPQSPPVLPDWLTSVRDAEPAPATASAASGLPDWLAPTAGVDDWLTATSMPEAAKRPDLDQFGRPPSPPLPPPEREPLPESDWLSGTGSFGLILPPVQAAEGRVAHPQAGAPEEIPTGDLPDWLRAMCPAGAEEAPERPEPPPPPTRTPTRKPPPRPAPSGEPEGEAAPVRPATIPLWLAAMRPLELSRPALSDLAEETTEAAGPLAGMRGLLRAEPVVALPRKPEPVRNRLEVSDVHSAQAELLRGLLEEKEREAPASARARMRLPVERWLIALILLAAVLVPLVLNTTTLPRPETIAPETLAAGTLINELEPEKPVLLAFEYDPASAGELDTGARAVVDHLMAKGLRVVTLSTHPAGAGLAARLVNERAADYGYQYGKDFVNFGYVPGMGVGLRALAGDVPASLPADFAGDSPWSQPAVAGVKTLADFGLIVVISATPDGIRQWVEQVKPIAGSVPFIAVISAGAEPLVRPYYESAQPQLAGLITGLLGAGGYEQFNGRPGLALGRWDAYGYGLIASVAVLLVGALISGVKVVLQTIGLLRPENAERGASS